MRLDLTKAAGLLKSTGIAETGEYPWEAGTRCPGTSRVKAVRPMGETHPPGLLDNITTGNQQDNIMAKKRTPNQLKNPEQYEALRKQGMSKEKAARIVNAGRSASVKGGKSPKYED